MFEHSKDACDRQQEVGISQAFLPLPVDNEVKGILSCIKENST